MSLWRFLPLPEPVIERLRGSLALRWALVVTLVAGTGLGLMVHAWAWPCGTRSRLKARA